MKCDLKKESPWGSVSPSFYNREVEKSEGEELAKRIGAKGFFECSSEDNINIEIIFETAIRAAKKLSQDDTIKLEIPIDEMFEIPLTDEVTVENSKDEPSEGWCSLISCGKLRFLKC